MHIVTWTQPIQSEGLSPLGVHADSYDPEQKPSIRERCLSLITNEPDAHRKADRDLQNRDLALKL